MPTCGTTASSTAISVNLHLDEETDPSRFRRLAQLLFTPSTNLIVGVTS